MCECCGEDRAFVIAGAIERQGNHRNARVRCDVCRLSCHSNQRVCNRLAVTP